jgi:hypothetical protein
MRSNEGRFQVMNVVGQCGLSSTKPRQTPLLAATLGATAEIGEEFAGDKTIQWLNQHVSDELSLYALRYGRSTNRGLLSDSTL